MDDNIPLYTVAARISIQCLSGPGALKPAFKIAEELGNEQVGKADRYVKQKLC